MKYIHNVLFDISNLDTDKLNEAVIKFKQIKGVEKVLSGENITPEKDKTGGYNYGLTVIFASYDDLVNYASDPIHLEFKKLIKNSTNSVRVMDFSINE